MNSGSSQASDSVNKNSSMLIGFSPEVLGIILSVTTASEDITTARRLCLQWKLITTARTSITTAQLLAVRETRIDKHRKDIVYILFY